MQRPNPFHYFFSVMGPASNHALVILANAGEGPWEVQLHPVPHDVPEPVDFWNVSPGPLSVMLDRGNLKLFRSDLIDALHDLSIADFQAFAARIRAPQGADEITHYSVIKPNNVLHLKAAQIGAHEVATTHEWHPE